MYGPAAFAFEVIELIADVSLLREREQHHMDAMRAQDSLHGYNMAPAVRAALTKEQRAKQATSKHGRFVSEETKRKIAATLTGRKLPPFTDEHKSKIRAANAGRKRTPEQCERIRQAQLARIRLFAERKAQ